MYHITLENKSYSLSWNHKIERWRKTNIDIIHKLIVYILRIQHVSWNLKVAKYTFDMIPVDPAPTHPPFKNMITTFHIDLDLDIAVDALN